MYNYKTLDPDKCEFIAVAPVEELPNGERLFVEIDNETIVVFNIGGEYFAIADVCSHDDGPLGDGELDGYVITCPRHGATFDVRTGKVLSLPAIVDIPAYPTRVQDGQIEVGLPLKE
ncbi:MAG: non-heme iron oxygenase ferredoxin subunit [Chloroflexi bacterium]|nr:non-heme iron oxygenase ferredoxin subunit [Chloroflexota bacterium]